MESLDPTYPIDTLTQPLVILLILSLITEKFSNIIKLFFPSVRLQESDPGKEKKREKSIQLIAIGSGIAIAIMSGANIFELFKNNFGWFWKSEPGTDYTNADLTIAILGCILTGFFLSFGSKLFHDLLDLVLEIKNLKRKINEKNDWEFNNIKEVEEYLIKNDAVDFKAFVDSQLKNIANREYHVEDFDNKTATLYVSKETTGVPGMLFYKSSAGKVIPIKVNVVVSKAPIETLSVVKPSQNIKNYDQTQSGAIFYPVRYKDSLHFLTCYHVVWHNGQDWDAFEKGDRDYVVLQDNKKLGEVSYAIKNYRFDIAFIKPEADFKPSYIMPNTPYDGLRPLDMDLLPTLKGKKVKIVSRFDNNKQPSNSYHIKNGVISEINVNDVNIKYPDGNIKTLDKLVKITTNNGIAFSLKGDSGAMVFDDDQNAIAMIVAGNQIDTSFAIPVGQIFKEFNLNPANP